MQRTQIYLTEAERKALRQVARRLGSTQSEVIRAAVDRYLASEPRADRVELLRRARGMWKHRRDLPDFGKVRREMDRRFREGE